MKKSDNLRAKIAELSDEAEALVNIAEKEGRELSADETSRWSALMAKDSGEIARLQVDLQAAIAQEEEVARLRALRMANVTPAADVFDRTGARPANTTTALPDSVRWVSPNLRAFKSSTDREQNLRDCFDAGLWFKAAVLSNTRRHAEGAAAADKLRARRGDSWLATMNETTPTDGGFLVPPVLQNALIVYREQVGVARRLCRVMPMSSDNLTFLRQTAGTTVYYPGEEGQITASSPTFGMVQLQAKKRAILSYVSNELKDDALIGVMDVLVSDMGHQFAFQEDKELILGDATSTYGGVEGVKQALTTATASLVSAATNNDTWPEITYADLAKAMAALPDKFRGMPCAWLCSAAFKWQVFDRLCLAQGGALEQSMANGIPGAMFAGYPIVVSDRMPTTTAAATLCAIFGAFGNAVALGDRNEVRIATSEHIKFDYDQIGVRATVRYDINVFEEGDTTNAGALIGFKTAS